VKSHGFLEKTHGRALLYDKPRRKFRIQEAFAQHGIEYKMKVEDYSRPGALNASALGALGNHHTPRLITIFYVREEDAEAALHLIRC